MCCCGVEAISLLNAGASASASLGCAVIFSGSSERRTGGAPPTAAQCARSGHGNGGLVTCAGCRSVRALERRRCAGAPQGPQLYCLPRRPCRARGRQHFASPVAGFSRVQWTQLRLHSSCDLHVCPEGGVGGRRLHEETLLLGNTPVVSSACRASDCAGHGDDKLQGSCRVSRGRGPAICAGWWLALHRQRGGSVAGPAA